MLGLSARRAQMCVYIYIDIYGVYIYIHIYIYMVYLVPVDIIIKIIVRQSIRRRSFVILVWIGRIRNGKIKLKIRRLIRSSPFNFSSHTYPSRSTRLRLWSTPRPLRLLQRPIILLARNSAKIRSPPLQDGRPTNPNRRKKSYRFDSTKWSIISLNRFS